MSKPHLRIDSHVVVQLGAELISDSEQALLELVKNAYDADASKCVIAIDPDWEPDDDDEWSKHLKSWRRRSSKTGVGRIVVMDDGQGVDPEGVENGWLYISASLKRVPSGEKQPTNIRKRIPVGDKGLGRLATMRLGEVLLLRTMTPGEKATRSVAFAWSSFKSGASLDDVDVSVGQGEKLSGRSHGTNVEILGLTDPDYWSSEESISGAVAKLSSLISPFRRFKDFQVNIRSGGQDHDLQTISAEALNFASSKFEFSYSGGMLRVKAFVAKSLFRGQSGEMNRRLYDEIFSDENLSALMLFLGAHPRVKSRNFIDMRKSKGGWLFSLEEEIPWIDIPREPRLSGAVDPGPFDGEIHNFLFNDQTKEQLRAANVPLGVLQGMTTVGMFRDGFRVRMSDDWLELAKGVTSGGFFQLRPRNVVGYFAISNKENSNLVEKSDREGFVDNDSWRGFLTLAFRVRKFANDSLDAVRTAYDEYKKEFTGKSAEGAKLVEDRESHINEQELRARTSLSQLRERNDDLTQRVAKAKSQVAALQGSPEILSKASRIVKDLERVETGLVDVRERVEVAELATRSGFDVAGDVLVSHGALEERNLRLLDAAAVGLSARALIHEINTHLNQLSRSLIVISSATKGDSNEKLRKAVSSISDVLRELKKTVAAIDPLAPGSRTLKDSFDVYGALAEFFHLRSGRLEAANVKIRLSGVRGLVVRFSRARFTQVLENLLQNSLYWIDEHSDEIGDSDRYIKVEIDQTGFSWQDSGKGVRPAVEDSILEPYVTDKPQSKGQGLGLFIVNSFLQAERCSISLQRERNKYKRRFIFRIDLNGAARRDG